MLKLIFDLAVMLLLSTGMAFAASDDTGDDDAGRDPLGEVNCDWNDDHTRHECTCSGQAQCDALQNASTCERFLKGADGSSRWVNDFHCPQEYQDAGELVCQCTAETAFETPGTSTRPDRHSPGTENAPTPDRRPIPPPSPTRVVPDFSAPTGLRIANAGGDRLRFTWRDNSNNEDGFVIERLLPMTNATSTIATVRGAGETMGSRSETVRVQGARNRFCYQVRATRGSSRTEPSERACASLN